MLEVLFYPYGIVLRHNTEAGATERIISPESLAEALAAEQKPLAWTTGMLAQNTVFVGAVGDVSIVAEYRKPQKTGLYFDGSEEPVRVPMPGLILIRRIQGKNLPTYRIFAVKRRPSNIKTKLMNVPLPNVGQDGVCWGTVPHLDPTKRHAVDLTEDWKLFLGSRFGDHSVAGKSKAFKDDIRKQLLKLDREQAKTYPTDDLVETTTSLKALLSVDIR